MFCDREKHVVETVLPNAAKLGRFGPRMKFLRCEKENAVETAVQFGSSVVFLTAVFEENTDSGDAKEKPFRLVIKFLPNSLKTRELMNSIVQFHNENVMYYEMLPFLEYNDIVSTLFPTFYYGEKSEADGKQPIVVIEDLREKNYKISEFKLFLDYNHVVIILQALGRFHALSYIAKQKHPDEFNKIRNRLQEHAWNRPDSANSPIGPCSLRGVTALYDFKKNDTLKNLIERLKTDSLELMRYFVKPEEPVAVICHGDFCNHNLLFKYDDSSPDVPTSVKFFDLQTSRYASPVIDLSMILYLNTDYELRSRHWDEFLNIYYNSMSECVSAANCIPPTFEQLLDEFKNKSFYGYFHCSYFLPMMLSESPVIDIDMFEGLEPDAVNEMLYNVAGEKGTQGLVSIVKHLDELNYFGFLNK